MIKYSFVIPTYNRIHEVCRAIDSVIPLLEKSGSSEIIVVDDNSNDGTEKYLRDKYAFLISTGFFIIKSLSKNRGVVNARVVGAKIARGKWLIPIDSDNEFLHEEHFNLDSHISQDSRIPCYLFLCIDENNNIIGSIDKQIKEITFDGVLNSSLPELFGIYNRDLFLKYFDNNFLIKLRRFEVIGNLNILLNYGDFALIHLPLRKYYSSGNDRLSGRSGLIRDAKWLFLGNLGLLRFFCFKMNFTVFSMTLLKVVYYFTVFVFNKFKPLK
jgi:glycosyltransferase involved in cell wall biosynthesis